MRFKDRNEAGRLLAKELEKYKGADALIYALPRGGVVLGAEIAERLDLPLDLIIPRKIGHPLYPEYAIGAVTEAGQVILNHREAARHDTEWLKSVILKEVEEAKRRRIRYLKSRPKISVKGKTAIIVDDGIATGMTAQAAIKDLKNSKPAKIVLAIPVVPRDAAKELENEIDELVALDIPRAYLGSVGAYYDEFEQVEDEEVIQYLKDQDRARSNSEK